MGCGKSSLQKDMEARQAQVRLTSSTALASSTMKVVDRPPHHAEGRGPKGIINWGYPTNMVEKGDLPRCVLNNQGHVVVLHHIPGTMKLQYLVGEASSSGLSWGVSEPLCDAEDTGIGIMDDETVVEVHSRGEALFYRVGNVCGDRTVDWGDEHEYAKGFTPCVSLMEGGTVIECHMSNGQLGSQVGIIKGRKIKFSQRAEYAIGHTPSISCNSRGEVVEIHSAESGDGLLYRVGLLKGQRIKWGRNSQFAKGRNGTVCINDDGFVILTYKLTTHDKIMFVTGRVRESKEIEFLGEASYLTDGFMITVGLNDAQTMVAFSSTDDGNLSYFYSAERNLERWMEAMGSLLWERRLFEITLPGSNLSGTYHLTNVDAPIPDEDVSEWMDAVFNIDEHVPCPENVDPFINLHLRKWAVRQTMNVRNQLACGIRYLDLPVCFAMDDFYVYHALIGPRLRDILGQILAFLLDVDKEVLIVDIRHRHSDTKPRHVHLISLVVSALGGFLYPVPTKGVTLASTKFGDMVKSGPRAVLLYESSFLQRHPHPQVWPRNLVVSEQSNMRDVKEMEGHQQMKLFQGSGNPSHLFKLDWTLLPNESDIIKAGLGGPPRSMKDVNREAALALEEFAQDNLKSKYRINIIALDFFQHGKCVNTCIQLTQEHARQKVKQIEMKKAQMRLQSSGGRRWATPGSAGGGRRSAGQARKVSSAIPMRKAISTAPNAAFETSANMKRSQSANAPPLSAGERPRHRLRKGSDDMVKPILEVPPDSPSISQLELLTPKSHRRQSHSKKGRVTKTAFSKEGRQLGDAEPLNPHSEEEDGSDWSEELAFIGGGSRGGGNSSDVDDIESMISDLQRQMSANSMSSLGTATETSRSQRPKHGRRRKDDNYTGVIPGSVDDGSGSGPSFKSSSVAQRRKARKP